MVGLNGSMSARPAAVAGGALQVEEERLDHVLGHLAGDQVDEVAALDLRRVVEVDLRALHRRRHDVVRRRVVGALELLAQVGREGGQVRRQRRGRRGAAGDLVVLVDIPRLLGLGVGGDPLLGRRDQLVAGRHELVDDADLQCLGRAQPLALEQQLHQRVDDAQHPHRADDAAGAGEQAELDLGEAEQGLGVVDHDPVVAGQRDLQPAAERRAVDGRDHRLAQRLQPPQHRLVLTHEAGDLFGVVLGGALEVVQVAAGEERLLGRGDDHPGDLVLLSLEAVDRRLDRRRVGGVHGVGRLVGVVQGQDHDAVVVLVPADRAALSWQRSSQTRSTTVAMPMPPPTHSVASP